MRERDERAKLLPPAQSGEASESKEERGEMPDKIPKHQKPSRGGLLTFFSTVSILAIIAAVLLAAAQPTICVTQWKQRTTIDIITRIYVRTVL